ncbi:MAG: TonB-dependent receptor [Candidatus Solibacter usitatus]|nr:TonB-dependent receptor [Candidatus Solibacter usitatus]
MKRSLFLALIFVAVLAMALAAQTITGSITGVITDSTGAVIPGATVQVINTDTNVRTSSVTDAGGNYSAALLPRGNYRLQVSAKGFKGLVREGIVLQVQQTARIDLQLAVGEVTESVMVTADAMKLETENATLAKVVDNRAIINLPLNTRNVYNLVFLTPGVTGTVGNSYGDMRYSVNGARARTMDTMIDGVSAAHPTVNGFNGISVFPSVDAIEEFKLLSADYPAEFGRSLGSVLNVVFKSGSNQWHGSAFEFLRNSKLDANDFFSNRRGTPLLSFKRSQYGGVVNGPVVRDKTFFMISYEALRARTASSTIASVPTQLERSGDFSQTRAANGQVITIYDPLTTRANPSGSGFIRSPFSGNVIPAGRFDPVAVSTAKYYPQANTTPTGLTNNQNNWANSASKPLNTIQSDYRADQIISSNQRFFVRYSTRLNDDIASTFFPAEVAVAEGRINEENHVHGGVVDYTNTLSPTMIFSARAGVARTLYVYSNQSLGFAPSSLGLPKYIDAGVDVFLFPGFSVTDYRGLGGGDHRNNGFMTYTAVANLTKLRGNHNFKGGVDLRLMRVNVFEARSASDYGFSRGMTQGPNPSQSSTAAGNGFASMLLGTGSSGQLQANYKNVATQSLYVAGYFQDEWRVTPKLSLSLGVRWDVDVPRTERYNRTNYFDTKVATPASQAVPGITGGLIFVGLNGVPRQQFKADKNNIAPRFGLSYQVAPKTVLRLGYAHIYGPSQQAAAGTIGTMGFRVDNTWVASIDGITPNNYLRDPYPQGIAPVVGARNGVMTQFGSSIEATTQDIVSPWTRQVNFNVQRELPAGTLLEVAYVGTRGFYLHRNDEGGLSLNQLDPKYMALGSALNQQVDNPFFGKFSGGVLSGAKTSRAQLLRPYPQFTNIIPIYSVGASSFYHSLQVSANKRYSYGLQMQLAYTWGKSLDDGLSHQDSYNIRADRALSDIDVAQRVVIAGVYDLPFGRSRHFGAGWNKGLDLALGGWQVNGITTLSSGTPLGLSASNNAGIFNMAIRANNNGQSGALSGPVQDRLSAFFDKAVFSQPAAFTFGNMGPRVSDIRNDGIFNWDLSVFKNFRVVEKVNVQFRSEFLNAFNTPRFSGPNTSVTSSSFGVISSQANAPRQIQFGLKVLF